MLSLTERPYPYWHKHTPVSSHHETDLCQLQTRIIDKVWNAIVVVLKTTCESELCYGAPHEEVLLVPLIFSRSLWICQVLYYQLYIIWTVSIFRTNVVRPTRTLPTSRSYFPPLHGSLHSLMAVRPLLPVPSEQRSTQPICSPTQFLTYTLTCCPSAQGQLSPQTLTFSSDARIHCSQYMEILPYLF